MAYQRNYGKSSDFIGACSLSAQEFQPKDGYYNIVYKSFREIWLDVPGFEDALMVSNYGRVFHKALGEITWGWPSGTGGYRRIQSGPKDHLVHRLVAKAF